MLKNYTKIKAINQVDKTHLNDEGWYHRLDGPAIEVLNGSNYWYINGNSHRNIDPATKRSDGEKYWWFKGSYHRIGGSCSSAAEYWFIDGKDYTKLEYFNIVWDI